MTKLINPGLMPTSGRNVLRGSMLAGAAALTGGVAAASTARLPLPKTPFVSSGAIKVQAEAIARAEPIDLSGLERVKQRLVQPPFAPVQDQVATGAPKIIEIVMDIREGPVVIDEDTGASIWALTYHGSVPGPLIITHEGNYVDFTLRNPAFSQMEHNIDFHASTGALGGGALTHIYPGEETLLRWKPGSSVAAVAARQCTCSNSRASMLTSTTT